MVSGFALGPRVAIVGVGDVCVTIRLWSVLSHCSQRVVVVYSTFSRIVLELVKLVRWLLRRVIG